MACCALISQCIYQSIILATDTYYQHAGPHLSPPIPPLLSLGLPLEFLQSSCGLRPAGGPAPGPGPCVGKGSCEAEHMLCPWFPFPPPPCSSFGLLLMAPYTCACTINPHGQRHLQFLCIFTLCAGHVPCQQFARRRLRSSSSSSLSSTCHSHTLRHAAALQII